MSALSDLLRARIATSPEGRLPFAAVMELALYHPEHGYYGAGPRRIGRQGDFFTSVSVGPLFGKLLALLALQEWQSLGRPPDFTLIEQGAHDGQLAQDVLQGLEGAELPYLIVEPNPRHLAAQRARLGDRARWAPGLQALQAGPAHGFFLCNELPDAFPVHLVRWDGAAWRELYVNAAMRLVPGQPSSAALSAETTRLPQDLEPGHTIEVNLAMLRWMRELAQAAFRGAVFIADYGLDAEEFLMPGRAGGTLRRYHQHQMDERVLEDLGACDLTSHVNFTRLIEEAARHGLRLREYDLQGRLLGRAALPWLREMEGCAPDAALMRQFQSLTHPAMMGRSFRCLILDKPAQDSPCIRA